MAQVRWGGLHDREAVGARRGRGTTGRGLAGGQQRFAKVRKQRAAQINAW